MDDCEWQKDIPASCAGEQARLHFYLPFLKVIQDGVWGQVGHGCDSNLNPSLKVHQVLRCTLRRSMYQDVSKTGLLALFVNGSVGDSLSFMQKATIQQGKGRHSVADTM